MKFPKLFKKAAALVMAAVTTFSVLPATTAFAAGDIGTISFDFTYDRNGNAMRYNSSAVFDGYTAGGTGSYKYRMYVDGDNAFCIQPGVPLKTGNTLKKNSSQTWNALSSSQKKAVGLALLYGYQGNRSSLSGSDDEKWLATQTLVWEFVTGCRESTGAYQQTSQKAYSLHFGSNYPNSGAAEVYNQIVSLMSKHNNFYCYCYVKEWLDRHMEKAAQGIRFIDPHYKELFRIPDGGKIILHLSWGETAERSCRFIDEYHTEIGGNIYHICEFAERMERNGHTYEPKPQEPPHKTVRHKEYER